MILEVHDLCLSYQRERRLLDILLGVEGRNGRGGVVTSRRKKEWV